MKQDGRGRRALLALSMAAALAGCGGGGGGGDAGATDTNSPTTVALGDTPGAAPGPVPGKDSVPSGAASDLAPACSNCGAVSANSYAGTGVGIWQKTNDSGVAQDVNVAISGLAGQDVTLVFTNTTAANVAMPAINTTLSPSTGHAQELRKDASEPGAVPEDEIREFNREGWARRVQEARAEAEIKGILRSGALQAVTAYQVGATRSFHHSDNTTRTARLQKQLSAGDGTVVNVWVETNEIGDAKVSAAISDQLATSFGRAGGIYDMLKAAGGPLWGAHSYPELISGTGRPVDIVVLNFDRNQQAYGVVGFYWSMHQFTKAADSRSSESVALFLDSETTYLGGARGLQVARMTLAHEAMHMSNFYRRGVSMGQAYQFDTWLEEMTAIMMEDAAASAIDASYQPLRDQRLRDYLRYGSYNCALKTWTPYAGTCESYAVSGSFGGFLLRHLGVAFFRDLLQRRLIGSDAVLSAAIQAARPGSGIGPQMQSFAASAIGTMPADAPAGYGFPARNEGGFQIPAVDASAFSTARTMPAGSPSSLLAYANFPVARRAINGTYSERVRVPAGATLSVVVR